MGLFDEFVADLNVQTPEEPRKAQAEAGTQKKAANNKPALNRKPQEVKLPAGEHITIRYAGMSFPYVVQDGDTLETVRQRLESEGAVELTAERTHLEWDADKKLVVVTLKAATKGQAVMSRVFGSSREMARAAGALNYLVTRAGVYIVRRSPVGIFSARLDSENVPEVVRESGVAPQDNDFEEGIRLFVPPIPENLLRQAVNFFRVVYAAAGTEAAVQVFYRNDSGRYLLHVPPQSPTVAGVTYERSAEMEERFTLVMDIHSHGAMSAFWSATDDADEAEPRLYAVVGRVHHITPEVKVRYAVGPEKREIPLERVFRPVIDLGSIRMTWLANAGVRLVSDNVFPEKKGGNHRGGYDLVAAGALLQL